MLQYKIKRTDPLSCERELILRVLCNEHYLRFLSLQFDIIFRKGRDPEAYIFSIVTSVTQIETLPVSFFFRIFTCIVCVACASRDAQYRRSLRILFD